MDDPRATAELRRRYGVPETVRLRHDARATLAFVEGAEDAARTVAAEVDHLPLAPGRGRGRLRRLPSAFGPLVVREYRKGGMLRAVRGRRFHGRLRPLDELALHRRLLGAQVPVVDAVGAVVLHGAIGWRGFLLMREVDVAIDLEALLYDPGLHTGIFLREALVEAGRAVRALHDAGVSHPDLHPKNLLLEGRTGRVLVIDLDRARAYDGPLPEDARLSNLVRLGRAVEKHRLRGMRAGRREALRFLAGYAGGADAAPSWLERVRTRLGRGLAARVAWWRLTGQAEPHAPASAGGAR